MVFRFQACVLGVCPGHFSPNMASDAPQLTGFEKLWTLFDKNRKQVTWAAAILVGGGLVFWFMLWRQAQKELTASEALSNVSFPQASSGTRPDSAEAYLKVAAAYPNSSAGTRAVLLAAGSLFAEGKYTEAHAQFGRFAHEHPDSPFVGEALLGLAACLDVMNKTNEAVLAYKELIDHHPNETVIPQAKFALARLYEAQNKPEQARPLFEDVYRNNPYDSLGSEAGMRLEDLLLKYPPPAPLAPTNAPTLTLERATTNLLPFTLQQATTNPLPVNPEKPLTNPSPSSPEKAPTNPLPPKAEPAPTNAPPPAPAKP